MRKATRKHIHQLIKDEMIYGFSVEKTFRPSLLQKFKCIFTGKPLGRERIHPLDYLKKTAVEMHK